MKSFRWVLVVLAVVLIGGGAYFANYYYNSDVCGVKKVEAAIGEMQDLAEEWDDAYNVASSTSRIGLAGPISDMQQIKRDIADVEVPVCLEEAQHNLEYSMSLMIDGFLAFMGEESDAMVGAYISQSLDQMDNFEDAIKEVSECMPFCNN